MSNLLNKKCFYTLCHIVEPMVLQVMCAIYFNFAT